MIGACKRAWRYYYVALALSWTVSYALLRFYGNGKRARTWLFDFGQAY
jgi:hypothetical protein